MSLNSTTEPWWIDPRYWPPKVKWLARYGGTVPIVVIQFGSLAGETVSSAMKNGIHNDHTMVYLAMTIIFGIMAYWFGKCFLLFVKLGTKPHPEFFHRATCDHVHRETVSITRYFDRGSIAREDHHQCYECFPFRPTTPFNGKTAYLNNVPILTPDGCMYEMKGPFMTWANDGNITTNGAV
jgi:hypothetical protein